MSLSERLQHARTQRLIQAGVLPRDHALQPEPELETTPVDEEPEVSEPITIEVQATALHLVAEGPADLTELPEGEPASHCPNCKARGHLDMVDLVGHTVHLTCEACGTMWQVRHSVDQTIIH